MKEMSEIQRIDARRDGVLDLSILRGPQATKPSVSKKRAEALREQLLAECKVEPIFDSREEYNRVVSFRVPAGVRPIDVLTRADEISQALYGRDAVWCTRLEKWTEDDVFTTPYVVAEQVTIIGCVADTANLRRDEQMMKLQERGMELACTRDVAVAHTLFFVATGENLFGVHAVRTAESALYYIKYGLSLDCFDHGVQRKDCGAAGISILSKDRNRSPVSR